MIDFIKTYLNHPIYGKIITITFWIIIIYIIRFFILKTLNKSVQKNDHKYKIKKALNLLSSIFIIIVLLILFKDKIGQVGIVLGLASAGIAFALQEVIVSFFGWIYISFSGVVSTGDRVRIGNIKGDIIDIGVLSTTLMEVGDWVDGDLYNGRILTIANSYIIKENIYNYSAEFPFLWDEISIPIRIGSDYKEAKIIFNQILDEVCRDYSKKSEKEWKQLTNKYLIEEAQVSPMVTLRFNENCISFTLRYVVDYKKRRLTKDIISSKILDSLADNKNIRISTNTMEVTMKN